MMNITICVPLDARSHRTKLTGNRLRKKGQLNQKNSIAEHPSIIKILCQKIHEMERAPAVNHLVDQITFAARKLLDHALRRGPNGFVCSMNTCRE